MTQGQIGNPQVKQMFDTLDITGDGTDAKISVKMSDAEAAGAGRRWSAA